MPSETVIFRDFDPRFSIGANGDIKQLTNIDAIYASIENILLTITGERVMLREFPGALSTLLMEPMIGDALRRNAEIEYAKTIQKWDDRIQVLKLDISLDQDNDAVVLHSEFYIQGYENVFILQKTIN